MNAKEELRKLIKQIKNSTGLTQEQISVEAGYEEKTLTQALSRQKGHEAVIKQLNLVFGERLKNTTIIKEPTYKMLLDPKEQATDIVELKAFTKTLLHGLAKLQAKVYGVPVDECLNELVQDTRLNVRDLMERS